jgi:hypothetical protein
MLGPPAGGPSAGSEPDPGHSPGLGPAEQLGRGRIVDCADGQQDVARPGQEAYGGDGVQPFDVDGRERPLPDDDRVDEFDRDVPAVCRPLRCDAPHGRPGGESPGQ